MKLERIQILRFFAAAAVLCYHASGTLYNHLKIADPNIISNYGYYGVDLFFVISGFIIYIAISKKETIWSHFLIKRLIRVLPLYWFCTILMFVLLPIFGDIKAFNKIIFAKSLLFLSWTTGPDAMPTVYLGWSLEYEVLFYSLCAFFLVRFKSPYKYVITTICIMTFFSFLYQLNSPSKILHFLVNPIMLEFAFGIFVGACIFEKKIPWFQFIQIMFVTIAVSKLEWAQRVIVAGIPSAIFVAVCAKYDIYVPIRSKILKALSKAGDASYSIYLSQVFTISALVKIGEKFSYIIPHHIILIMIMLIGLFCGILCYNYLEKPMSKLINKLIISMAPWYVGRSRA